MRKIILALCILILLAAPSMAVLRINREMTLITGGAGNFTNVTVNNWLFSLYWLNGANGNFTNLTAQNANLATVNVTSGLTSPNLVVGSGSFIGNMTSDGVDVKFNIPGGHLQVNNENVCLENGTYCSASSPGGGGTSNLTSEQVNNSIYEITSLAYYPTSSVGVKSDKNFTFAGTQDQHKVSILRANSTAESVTLTVSDSDFLIKAVQDETGNTGEGGIQLQMDTGTSYASVQILNGSGDIVVSVFQNGTIRLNSLTGTGNGYVCINGDESLRRNTSAGC